jgi:hypothetical protein
MPQLGYPAAGAENRAMDVPKSVSATSSSVTRRIQFKITLNWELVERLVASISTSKETSKLFRKTIAHIQKYTQLGAEDSV